MKISFEIPKIKIELAVQTVRPPYLNTIKIKGIFFSHKNLLKKYPKADSLRPFFIIESCIFSIKLNEINGDELYIIKT